MRRHSFLYAMYLSARSSVVSGAILLLLLVVQSISGAILVAGVSSGVTFTINMLNLHRYLPVGIFVVACIHIFRAVTSKLRISSRGYFFLSGLVLFVSLFGIFITGCVLSGGQLGLWVVIIAKSIAVKLISIDCFSNLAVDFIDLTRRGTVAVYLIHFSGSFVLILAAYIHILAAHQIRGTSTSAGGCVLWLDRFVNRAVFDDAVIGILYSCIWIPFMFVFDLEYVASAEKYELTNQNLTPEHIRPEIYLAAYFILLRAFDLISPHISLIVVLSFLIYFVVDDYLRFTGSRWRRLVAVLFCFSISAFLLLAFYVS